MIIVTRNHFLFLPPLLPYPFIPSHVFFFLFHLFSFWSSPPPLPLLFSIFLLDSVFLSTSLSLPSFYFSYSLRFLILLPFSFSFRFPPPTFNIPVSLADNQKLLPSSSPNLKDCFRFRELKTKVKKVLENKTNNKNRLIADENWNKKKKSTCLNVKTEINACAKK